jgi:UDPglucose 6-dehydrogenase
MRIGIVGYGVVGRAIARFFEHSHEIVLFDKYLVGFSATERRASINNCELVFVCVPTPTTPQALSGDMSAVVETAHWVQVPMCIRSTILPGTTETLIAQTGKSIAFSPEYLGEAPTHPWRCEQNCGFLIVGGINQMTELVFSAYRPIVPHDFRFVQTDAITAELCKYMENCFLATKVAFVNQFYDIASRLGVDFEQLRALWLLDPRVGYSHTTVSQERGFGGRCLPKDLQAIITLMGQKGTAPLLEAVLAYNNGLRSKDLQSASVGSVPAVPFPGDAKELARVRIA